MKAQVLLPKVFNFPFTYNSKIKIKIGDIVEIFGTNKSLEKFAIENNTIPYEILCNIDKNIPKIIV